MATRRSSRRSSSSSSSSTSPATPTPTTPTALPDASLSLPAGASTEEAELQGAEDIFGGVTDTGEVTAASSSSSSTAPASSSSSAPPAGAAAAAMEPGPKRSKSSAKTAILRLMSDYQALQNEPPEGCSASPISDDNMFVWKACIFGPEDTPWEGGVFQLRLQFTQDYPQSPPTVRFLSRMFHPNIYKEGSLCLDIIQAKWRPIYTVGTILTSIQSLLQDPNPESPANPDAARLWATDRKAYNRMVRLCVENSA